MNRICTVLALVAAVRALPAQQGATDAERLGDFYRRAARANPRIAAAGAVARAAAARVAGVRRPPDPQLQFGFMNYSLPGLTPMPTLGMVQLQLMQMIPVAGKLPLAGRAALAQSSAAAARADDVAWELRTQVAMAFYDLAATDRSLVVARETLRLLQEIATTAASMYRVGEGRQGDVLRARVEIARMAEDTLRMYAMRETSVARLNALLDRESEVVITRVELPRFPEELPSRASLDANASTNRAMIRADLEDVRGASARERLARRELIPDLQVGIQFGQQRSSGVGSSGMAAARATERMGSFMVGASVPIFARHRQLQMREEAAAMRQMAQAELAATRAETRARIGEAYASLERARRLERLYRTEILPQAEASVTSSLAAYRVGSVDFMTLLESRMSVNRYRQELSTLAADQGKSWAELEMLIGRELFNPDTVAQTAMVATPDASRRDAESARRGIP